MRKQAGVLVWFPNGKIWRSDSLRYGARVLVAWHSCFSWSGILSVSVFRLTRRVIHKRIKVSNIYFALVYAGQGFAVIAIGRHAYNSVCIR